MPNLYLMPMPIGEIHASSLPESNLKIMKAVRVFIVERARTARRMFKLLLPEVQLDQLIFIEMNKHKDHVLPDEGFEYFDQKESIGLLSECGLPCVADPGNKIVNIARDYGYQIKPLAGPSSIMMALMASGLNGQVFEFHGYLPMKEPLLSKTLRQMDKSISANDKTHLFIETPYRNLRLIETILKTVSKELRLCVACSIGESFESIETHRVGDWQKLKLDKYKEKAPMVFLMGR